MHWFLRCKIFHYWYDWSLADCPFLVQLDQLRFLASRKLIWSFLFLCSLGPPPFSLLMKAMRYLVFKYHDCRSGEVRQLILIELSQNIIYLSGCPCYQFGSRLVCASNVCLLAPFNWIFLNELLGMLAAILSTVLCQVKNVLNCVAIFHCSSV